MKIFAFKLISFIYSIILKLKHYIYLKKEFMLINSIFIFYNKINFKYIFVLYILLKTLQLIIFKQKTNFLIFFNIKL